MRERFIFTFLFHLFAISLILIPDKYKGPEVAAVIGIPLRAMDAAAIILIFAGSAFLFGSLFLFLKTQARLTGHPPANNGAEKRNNI